MIERPNTVALYDVQKSPIQNTVSGVMVCWRRGGGRRRCVCEREGGQAEFKDNASEATDDAC